MEFLRKRVRQTPPALCVVERLTVDALYRRVTRQTVGLLVAFVFAACNGAPVAPSLSELQSAPEEVVLAGHRYILESYLWRDFQPVAPPGGHPLIASIRLVEADRAAIPAETDMTRLWVINGKEVWHPPLRDENGRQVAYRLERLAREGPKWDPGIRVAVVIEVVHGSVTVFLQAQDQLIRRTS